MGLIRTCHAQLSSNGLGTFASDGTTSTASANRLETTGDFFDNNGRTFLVLWKSSGASQTAEFATPGKITGHNVAERTVNLPTNGWRIYGPFDTDVYNQKTGNNIGRVSVTFSNVTGNDLHVVALVIP